MILTDTHLNEMTRSAMTVAKKPDVGSSLGVLNVCLELGADFDMSHVPGESPEMLRRKVVPVVWGTGSNLRCESCISNSHYVMSSCHIRMNIQVDLWHSG